MTDVLVVLKYNTKNKIKTLKIPKEKKIHKKRLSTINRIDAATSHLGPLSPYPTGQLDVFGHDGDTLGMDGAQVGVLKQTHQVCLTGLLKSSNGSTLEAQISLEVLGDFSHQTLEGKLADEQLCGLLVTTDLPQSHSSRPVTMRLLHSTSGGCALPGSLGGELLPWRLSSGRFTGGLLSTCHLSLSSGKRLLLMKSLG